MNAFLAMLLDAYRELNARKLFWITLGISVLLVLGYGSIGFNESGIFILFGVFSFENEFLTAGSPLSSMVYRTIFSGFIVSIWFAWVATILALISTASMFPDFVSGGAVDLVVSKPISRPRLFFYKYICGLLFVIVQISVLCLGIFVCMGVRLGEWIPMIFAAIPLITLFFSFLYSVCALVGIVTRSSLAALLLTMLFWFSIFSISGAQGILDSIGIGLTLDAERGTARVESMEQDLEQLKQEADSQSRQGFLEDRLESARAQRDRNQEIADSLNTWSDRIGYVRFFLPKTSETIGLLDRWLKRPDDLSFADLMSGNIDPSGRATEQGRTDPDIEAMRRMEDEANSISMWYILGTSIAFECVILFLACWKFTRRDY